MNKFLLILSLLYAFGANAQYISEIIDFTPAPGQLTNTNYSCNHASQSIVGSTNGMLSLGAFGGSVTFKFNQSVENSPNNPFGVDFVLYGNPLNTWSEPGIVWVMQDENNNNIADDTWYQLAGSDYYFSSTLNNYEVTYFNPNTENASPVTWTDNYGNNGIVETNSFYNQAYYPITDSFPEINIEEYMLSGTLIQGNIDMTNPSIIKSFRRDFGYVDNIPRNSDGTNLPDNPYTTETEGVGGDSFDISWAVDEDGNYVDLDYIDFVKVQTSMQANCGWSGEVSTEICGGIDVAENINVQGQEKCIVIKDLSLEISESEFQLEAFALNMGRLMENQNISWSLTSSSAYIDENDVLNVSENEEFTITAYLTNNTEITKTETISVNLPLDNKIIDKLNVDIYPNPATDFITISNIQKQNIILINSIGKIVFSKENCNKTEIINTENLHSGIYILMCNAKSNKIIISK